MSTTDTVTALTRDLVSTPAAVGVARDHTARSLRSWGLADLVDSAALVVSELCTNAIRASATPTGAHPHVRLHVARTPGAVILAIWDGTAGRPDRRPPNLDPKTLDPAPENYDANGGWGLPIVEALTTRQWVHATPPQGKWVGAELPTP